MGTDLTTNETHDEVKSGLVSANIRFSFKLYAEIVKRDFKQNIFVSPYSVANALTIAYNGAQDETQEAMAKVLELQEMSLDSVNQANAQLRAMLEKPEPGFQLVTANSLWGQKGIAFNPEFIHSKQNFYGAEIAEVDFGNPVTVAMINEWVAEKTNQKIPQIVEGISPSTLFAIINAVYFKGIWHELIQFDEEATEEGIFTLIDGRQKKHPMMSLPQPCPLRYYRDDNFEAVSLPYETIRMSMYIFLPSKHSNLTEFQETLTADNWERWMTKFEEEEGHIVLPRFKFEYATTLNEVLKALGMQLAFDRERANFGGISSTSKSIWIDEVKHKTFLEVNEKGTEASAATSVIYSFGLPSQPFQMVVDRPFFCAIRDNETGMLLFMGSIFEPVN